MKLINVRYATPDQLDWLVAKCEGASDEQLENYFAAAREYGEWMFTFNLHQGGEIIVRERLATGPYGDEWYAQNMASGINAYGETLLIAAMRCYVITRMGEEVEVPDETCQG